MSFVYCSMALFLTLAAGIAHANDPFPKLPPISDRKDSSGFFVLRPEVFENEKEESLRDRSVEYFLQKFRNEKFSEESIATLNKFPTELKDHLFKKLAQNQELDALFEKNNPSVNSAIVEFKKRNYFYHINVESLVADLAQYKHQLVENAGLQEYFRDVDGYPRFKQWMYTMPDDHNFEGLVWKRVEEFILAQLKKSNRKVILMSSLILEIFMSNVRRRELITLTSLEKILFLKT